MKVLILKPSSLGDIIHALPVLRLIKRQRPNWVIHWWVAKHFAPLLEMDPDIAALHYLNGTHGVTRKASAEVWNASDSCAANSLMW